MQDGKIETTVGIFVLAAIGIFIYMGFQVGAFRFDRGRYNLYTIYFKDISGLSRKADAKIAGVKVGWVENVTLHADGDMQAEVQIMVLKDYALYSDSYALVRQQGLLGPNYIEIIPGDPLLRRLEEGEKLGKPSVNPVSMDELMQQFKKIASNVEDITLSFKEALGGDEGKEQLRNIFANLNSTAERLSSFSETLDRAFGRNEENINAILELGPVIKEGIEKISGAFERDFERIATRFESTGDALEEASRQARDGLKSLGSVAEKIDEGKGTIGKLINEDETYKDLQVAVGGLKNYFAKVDRMQLIFDAHTESMHRPAENYNFEDAKGYFNVRLHPNEDHFYLVQMAASEKGFVDRREIHKTYNTPNGEAVNMNALNIDDATKLQFTFREKLEIYNRNTIKFGVQFGKIFKDIAVRFGLFEGSAGMGIDFDIPLGTDKFRWVTTLEAFDITGWNRKEDRRRPHLKWLNSMFIMRNIYLTFGADDFASKNNACVFVGAGLRFGDDDVKFLLGGAGGLGGGGGGVGVITGSRTVSN